MQRKSESQQRFILHTFNQPRQSTALNHPKTNPHPIPGQQHIHQQSHHQFGQKNYTHAPFKPPEVLGQLPHSGKRTRTEVPYATYRTRYVSKLLKTYDAPNLPRRELEPQHDVRAGRHIDPRKEDSMGAHALRQGTYAGRKTETETKGERR